MTRSERVQAMMAHVVAQEQSGKSRKAYCAEQGMGEHVLYYWRAKRQAAGTTVTTKARSPYRTTINPVPRTPATTGYARRKFEKALTNDKARAEHALVLIAWLYDIERTCAAAHMDPDQRKQYRDLHTRPILDRIGHWLQEEILLVAPKSPIGNALGYTLGLRPRLCACLAEGRYLIDNNLIENMIRPMAIGRKNYLFAGSHDAAQDAALMYSLLGTCKLCGVEPLAYLTDVVARISEHKANKLHELLPQNWQPLAK